MLYFTHRFSGKMALKGIYNGRFSFIAGVLKEEMEEVFRRVVKGGEDGDDRDATVAAVKEEFEHKKLYSMCLTGLMLNGFRLAARFFWARLKMKGMAEYYYEIRTLFFAVMYPLHESLVDERDKLKPDQIKKRIRQADWMVARLWLRRPLTWSLFPFSGVFFLIGAFFSSSFAIIHESYVDGRLVEKNYAEKGIVNQVGNVGEVGHLRRGRFLERLRIERFFRVKDQRDWEWMLLKFRVEHQTWQDAIDAQMLAIQKLELSDTRYRTQTNFDEYMREILSFVSEWVMIDSAVQIATIVRAFRKTINNEKVLRPTGGRWESREYIKLVNFFYLHGN